MVTVILVAGGIVLAVVLAFGAVFVFGMRGRWRILHRFLFWMQRSSMNPANMRTAGTKGAGYSVVRHVGRTSGRAYSTPVDVTEEADRFVITLPYSDRANWVRNVLANGSAEIVHEGRVWSADRPEIVPVRDVASCYGKGELRMYRLLGLRECLTLRKVGTSAALQPEPKGSEESRAASRPAT